MDFLNLFIIFGFVGAVAGIIYWYAKKVGHGEAKDAFEDPSDRKKVFIFSAGIIVFAGIVLFVLWFIGAVKF